MLFKRVNLCFSALQRHSVRSFKNFTFLNSSIYSKKVPIKNTLIASATALGLSLYVAHRSKIFCEADLDLECKDDLSTEKKYEEAIRKSRDILQRIKDEQGIPGLVVGVSVDGTTIWEEGMGYADVENRVLCSPDTVMRIASISKSITMAAVAKLWEQGKLDLDKPVQEYVPYFPKKTFDGKPVTITCRHLVSHLGGIRHYTNDKTDTKKSDKVSNKENGRNIPEMDMKEYYLVVKYDDIKSAVELFKDDPLVEKPGTKYSYSTHAWTLISAIIEDVSKEKFTTHITKLFNTLGMKNTFLEENEPIIYHRSRNYRKNKRGLLINTPYVDNSYKWAGGGILSTVGDLLQFGNAMLYSAQFEPSNDYVSRNVNKKEVSNDSNIGSKDVNFQDMKSLNVDTSTQKMLPGYLNSKTIKAMWTPAAPAAPKYGMGWAVIPEKQECKFCDKTNFLVYHTGGAVGASSVLFILPKVLKTDDLSAVKSGPPPKGTIVVILSNMHEVGLLKTASKIASLFENI